MCSPGKNCSARECVRCEATSAAARFARGALRSPSERLEPVSAAPIFRIADHSETLRPMLLEQSRESGSQTPNLPE